QSLHHDCLGQTPRSTVIQSGGVTNPVVSYSVPTVTTTPTASSVPAASSYVCSKCGRVHASNTSTTSKVTSYRPPISSSAVATTSYSTPVYSTTIPSASSTRVSPAPTYSTPTYSSPAYSTSAAIAPVATRSASGTQNVLSMLNAQRSRQGLRSLRYDPVLQSVAERRVQLMASTGRKGHPPGSFAPGRYEGVGWSSSFSPRGVSACYTSNPNMTVAGAAMARGRDGVYFAVVYR
ncbi:MAG: hypothetical protein AAFU85_34425, partial [Planctomycetota bacterium]